MQVTHHWHGDEVVAVATHMNRDGFAGAEIERCARWHVVRCGGKADWQLTRDDAARVAEELTKHAAIEDVQRALEIPPQ